jgi:hypothetical protein
MLEAALKMADEPKEVSKQSSKIIVVINVDG